MHAHEKSQEKRGKKNWLVIMADVIIGGEWMLPPFGFAIRSATLKTQRPQNVV